MLLNHGVGEDFFLFLNLIWRLITLQYCSGFCHTFTWISHRCTWGHQFWSPNYYRIYFSLPFYPSRFVFPGSEMLFSEPQFETRWFFSIYKQCFFFQKDFLSVILDLWFCFLKSPRQPWAVSNSLIHIYYFNNPSYCIFFSVSLDLFRFVSHVIDLAYSLHQLYLQLQMKVSMLLRLPSSS